jgi:predicted MFS family arabinose efflux permease
MLAGIASQVVWITFAPILDSAARYYGVTGAEIGYLAAVFPLVYIAISLPVGYFIDRYGFRASLLVGTLFLGAFSTLRPLTSSFPLLLAFQTLAGVGQPFVMNSISKLVRAWFPPEEAGLATGLGTLSLMLGIILGLALTPPLASSIGITGVLWAYAAYSLAVLGLVALLCREPSTAVAYREAVSLREILEVLKLRNIVLLSALFFLGVGAYTAFTTWVEPAVKALGVPEARTGLVGGMLTLGGIVGSIVIPALADKYSTRRRPMICCLAASAILWLAAYKATGSTVASVILFVAGFFYVSLAPLALDLSAATAGEEKAGAANSALWEFSQVGSLALIALFEAIGLSHGWSLIYPTLALLAAAMLALTLPLREWD